VIFDHFVWWIAAAALAVAEVMSGTFYVLMVAIGCLAGGIAALLGLGLGMQLVIAVVVGYASVVAWHRYRKYARPRPGESGKNPDLHLDIGATVEVKRWVEGHARVDYRGSQWDAVPEVPAQPDTGQLIVKAVRGSTLVLGSKSQSA
jgi:membrane protein implicated in regulation of membrane protease activity